MSNKWDEYVTWVNANPKKVCDKVKKSVARFEVMYKESQNKKSKYYFDEEEPNLIIQFAETYLKIQSDDGPKPIIIYPWQAFILAGIYGFKLKKDNARLCRTALISTAKKKWKVNV